MRGRAGTQSCSPIYIHARLWQLGCAVIRVVVWSCGQVLGTPVSFCPNLNFYHLL